MKLRTYAILLSIFSAGVFFTGGCMTEKGDEVIDNMSCRVQWSKNGKSVFYAKGPSERLMRSYNVSSKLRNTYNLPRNVYQCSVSPDNRAIAFHDGFTRWLSQADRVRIKELHVMDLQTAKTRKIHSANKDIA